MQWVAIDVHITGDAVTHRLAAAFRVRIAEAAGLLALAYAGMAQHAQDGSLAGTTDSQIEAWAHWHGKRGAFAAFFRAALCDATGQVRAWEKYNGAALRASKASVERARAWREKRRAERIAHVETRDDTRTDTGDEPRSETRTETRTETRNERRSQPRSLRRSERVANASTIQDITRHNQTALTALTATTKQPPPTAAVRGALLHDTHRQAFDELLQRVPGKESFAAKVEFLAGARASPSPITTYTWEIIGEAMMDLAQSDRPATHLGGFCRVAEARARGETQDLTPDVIAEATRLFLEGDIA